MTWQTRFALILALNSLVSLPNLLSKSLEGILSVSILHKAQEDSLQVSLLDMTTTRMTIPMVFAILSRDSLTTVTQISLAHMVAMDKFPAVTVLVSPAELEGLVALPWVLIIQLSALVLMTLIDYLAVVELQAQIALVD